jgi:hypothetical protein
LRPVTVLQAWRLRAGSERGEPGIAAVKFPEVRS